MYKIKTAALWLAFTLIIFLAIMSIVGAFIGTGRAGQLFNSPPLAVFWGIFLCLLVFGLFAFKRLIRVPGLLFMHLGCILILVGGIYGSAAGHKFMNEKLGHEKLYKGNIGIMEGSTENKVQPDGPKDVEIKPDPFVLPFAIRCKDFRLEYYDPGYLYIETADSDTFKLDAIPGNTQFISDEIGSIKVVGTFKNFKLNGKMVPFDEPGGASNPAAHIVKIAPDGTEKPQYIFEKIPGQPAPGDRIYISYNRVISDYISDLEIIEDGEIVAKKSIEVNKPLYYGGYHFYQSSYGAQYIDENGEQVYATFLSVTSDSGLIIVCVGFAMMCFGIILQLWIMPTMKSLKNRSKNGN
jgi:hypothetical protein